MIILGIDPGKKGGLCFINEVYDTIETYPMPLFDGFVDVWKIQEWIIEKRPTVAYIEKQQVRGNQGGNMTIGTNYGRLTAVLDLCEIDYMEVDPKQWQRQLGLSGDKDQTIQWCKDNWYYVPFSSYKKDGEPMANATLHDGIADAIAISVYGVRVFES